MLFNSIEYALFLPIVCAIFFLLPHKLRWLHLLLASCFFYMLFVPIYILILLFTIVVDYAAGIMIERAEGPQRKLYLGLSLAANIGVLIFFKYYNFLTFNINSVTAYLHLGAAIPYMRIILPLGLSFHTFQAMSYTIEVYRGHVPAERHFGIYALYVMFFPQLVAGPIERPQNMLHQFHEKKYFSKDNVVSGLQYILWGLIKKVVIADRLGLVVDAVFKNNSEQVSGLGMLVGGTFFFVQLYCDFSAYSDMAIGSAKILGFTLMRNFENPFGSKNITEYWRRFHLSLSTWLNDYVFKTFTVGFRELGENAVVLGLLLTFFISGVWHGAGWHFVVYGLLFGIAMTYEYKSRKWRKKVSKKVPARLYNGVSIFLTLLYVMLADVFFRASGIRQACYVISKMPAGVLELLKAFKTHEFWLGRGEVLNNPVNLLFCCALVAVIIAGNIMEVKASVFEKLNVQPVYIRWPVYYLIILIIWGLGVFGERQFIYFQF